MDKKTRNVIIAVVVIIAIYLVAKSYNEKMRYPYKDNVNVGEWYSVNGDYCNANFEPIEDIEDHTTGDDIVIDLNSDGTGSITYYDDESNLTWEPVNETDNTAYGVTINPENSNIPIRNLNYLSEYDTPTLTVNAYGEYQNGDTAYIRYNLIQTEK